MRNLKINEKKRTAELSLNKLFYHENSINKTTEDFKEVCEINVSKKNDRLIVEFNAKGAGISEITHEFLNHLIANMKNHRLV